MKVSHEKGYQAILYTSTDFEVTPIANTNKLKSLVEACEKARQSGVITHYVIRYVEAKYNILTPFEMGLI